MSKDEAWVSARSHESYAKNYSIIFPHDEPLAGRNMKKVGKKQASYFNEFEMFDPEFKASISGGLLTYIRDRLLGNRLEGKISYWVETTPGVHI